MAQELTQVTKGVDIEWPGVQFMGHDLFAMIYDSGIVNDAEDEFIAEERQECYVGYNPDENTFYMGFDTWPSDDEMDDNDLPNVLRFRLDGDRLVTAGRHYVPNRMFYSGGYKALHAHMPNLIDIRLD